MAGAAVGTAVASTASGAAAIPAAFLGTFYVVAPVCPHIPDRPGVIVYVKLLLAEGEPAVHHCIQPQLPLQQLLWNDEPGHGHMEGKMDGNDFVVAQNAADHHRLCLDVHQLVTVPLPDEVKVMLVPGWTAGHDDIDGESGFFHDVSDGVLAVLHLKLQGAAGAEPAFALKGEADALVCAMVHANQARHLAPADLADGVKLSDLLENSV